MVVFDKQQNRYPESGVNIQYRLNASTATASIRSGSFVITTHFTPLAELQ
jgi:hypothetical protein